MRQALLLSHILTLAAGVASAQTSAGTSISTGGSASASASQGSLSSSIASLGVPAGNGRMATAATPNGTTTNGQVIVVTQINPGNKPGEMGVAVSMSGGYTTTTTYTGSFGGVSGASTIVQSQALGQAFGGGSYNVNSSVITGVNGTTTTGGGGPGTSIVRSPLLNR